MIELHQLKGHKDCTACERHAECPRNPGVPTERWGLPPSPSVPVLVVVGPCSTYTDHILWSPFYGKTGDVLRNILLDELATLCTIYGTALVRCHSATPPKSRHYKSCRPHHEDDVRHILGEHPCSDVRFLLLGSDAVAQFHRTWTGKPRSFRDALASNGRPLQIATRQCAVFSTYYPGAVLRNNSLIHSVEDHIELLVNTIRGHAPVPTEPVILPVRGPRS
jgi:uracil-DNA glycosylase